MTRLLNTITDTWPHCPECDAVAYPAWATQHTAGCPLTHTNPDDWSTP